MIGQEYWSITLLSTFQNIEISEGRTFKYFYSEASKLLKEFYSVNHKSSYGIPMWYVKTKAEEFFAEFGNPAPLVDEMAVPYGKVDIHVHLKLPPSCLATIPRGTPKIVIAGRI